MKNLLCMVLAVLFLSHCGKEVGFTAGVTSEFFTQGYNPPHLDVLFIVDNRSPMAGARSQVAENTGTLFARLVGSSKDYRVAFLTVDGENIPGQIQPLRNPYIFTPSNGTIENQTKLVQQLVGQQDFNLQTSSKNYGFRTAEVALKTSFVPRAGVPLVLIFISYTDDESPVSTSISRVDYFKNIFLSSKAGNKDMIRVYAVNYVNLPVGVLPNEPNSAPFRCAKRYSNLIDDALGNYEANYFNLAKALGGETANLCESTGFGNVVNLDGLRNKELTKVFLLGRATTLSKTVVNVLLKEGQTITMPWKLDVEKNSVVFETAPPEGSTVQVLYLP